MDDGKEISVRTLSNLEAVNLWIKACNQGKGHWNSWVEENPSANVDFSEVNFGLLRDRINTEVISFSGFSFPDGKINFENAKFGAGFVGFVRTRFGNGDVIFRGAEFGNGDVNFTGAEAGVGHMVFRRALFGKGNCDFSFGKLGEGSVTFNDAVFDGDIDISSYGKKWEREFLFRGATFSGPINIVDTIFKIVPDFRLTELKKHISLNGIELSFDPSKIKSKREARVTISKIQRLKELSESAKNHDFSLRLHAFEMKINRWLSDSPISSFADYFYWLTSNYGQSISRPTISWFISNVTFSFLYVFFFTKDFGLSHSVKMLYFSFVNSFSVLPGSFKTREKLMDVFGELGDLVYPLYLIIVLHTVVSFTFIFLIGLGLRNRFRL